MFSRTFTNNISKALRVPMAGQQQFRAYNATSTAAKRYMTSPMTSASMRMFSSGSAGYADHMYAQWMQDPTSVHESW